MRAGGRNIQHERACDSFGAGGPVSLLVGSDYCWLRSTQPAASKTLSVAPEIPFYLISPVCLFLNSEFLGTLEHFEALEFHVVLRKAHHRLLVCTYCVHLQRGKYI